ncbi:MAG: hypothetical protein HKP14_11240 [Bacteroidia bacterium]|nr:hypothetical protein [Bacteroidia bacterium]
MSTINQRVELLIKKVANTKSGFSQSTGISTVILSHISSGRNKVSLMAVEQILKAYPKVNAEWLILGKSSMFKDELDKDLTCELKTELQELNQELTKVKGTMEHKINKMIDKINDLS